MTLQAMKKTNKLLSIWPLLGLLLAISLSGCARTQTLLNPDLPVGTIWQVPVDERGEADWVAASAMAREQFSGYVMASDATGEITIQDVLAGEGNQQDELQVSVRNMVEDDRIVTLVGATSNQASTRAAALVNFFELPMIIPSANGDDLMPSGNLWAFRLSAPGEAYAKHLFGTLLTKINLSQTTDADADSETAKVALRIAVLYEGNTFGESAAVATARAALGQEMEIRVYGNFDPETPDPERLTDLMNQIMEQDVQLVYLVTSSPAVGRTLVQLFNNRFQPASMPLLVGQAGGFATSEFLESEAASSIYVMRQQILADRCPPEIDSLYEAQTFAAIYLLEQAIQQAQEGQPEEKLLSMVQDPRAELAAFRELIRDKLKEINLNTPCLGTVAFDNSGQNKELKFELITAQAGQVSIVAMDEFLSAVRQRAGLGTSD
jgi:ABC-type branched-subunit amino acid transport system substrate-binding protein